MKKYKVSQTNLIIGIFILLFIIPIVIIVVGSRPKEFPKTNIIPQTNNNVSQKTVEPMAVKLIPDDVDWKAGETHEVDVEFDESTSTPDFLELVIIYDPDTLSLDNIEEGNLWTEQVVLINSIDNKLGKANLLFGKNIGVTNETTLDKVATFTFTVLDNPESLNTVVVLDPSSNTAFSGKDEVTYLIAEPLILPISQ